MPLTDVTVLEHSEAHFECQTNLDDITVDWYHSGKKVANGKKYQMAKQGPVHSLLIKDVLKKEAGSVQALVDNIQTWGKLNVEGNYSNSLSSINMM